MRKNTWSGLAAVAVGTLALAGSLQASTIALETYDGNKGAVATDATSSYIQDGYAMWAVTPLGTTNGTGKTTLTSLPTYVNAITGASGSGTTGGWSATAQAGDPRGPSGSKVEPGLLYSAATTIDTEADIFTLTLKNPVPDFYLAVFSDVNGSRGENAAKLRLRSSTGGDSTLLNTFRSTTGQWTNGIMDVMVFKVTGAIAGETLTLSGTSDKNNTAGAYRAYVSGIGFQAVPEPSTLALTAAGLGLMFRRHRS